MDGCTWCLCNEKMKKYHDEEWGVLFMMTTGSLSFS